MILYDFVLSANCYKVRLLASILDIKYETQLVDYFPGKEHMTEEFLKLNPLGEIPVLIDDDVILTDVNAILLYLVSKFADSDNWWPAKDPILLGKIMQWLSFADKIGHYISSARWHEMIGQQTDISSKKKSIHQLLRVLEDHLTIQEFMSLDWIVDQNVTLADLACFPFVALVEDGGVTNYQYPAIQRWMHRIADIPGYNEMPGINIKK